MTATPSQQSKSSKKLDRLHLSKLPDFKQEFEELCQMEGVK
jgi:hypothetical protein